MSEIESGYPVQFPRRDCRDPFGRDGVLHQPDRCKDPGGLFPPGRGEHPPSGGGKRFLPRVERSPLDELPAHPRRGGIAGAGRGTAEPRVHPFGTEGEGKPGRHLRLLQGPDPRGDDRGEREPEGAASHARADGGGTGARDPQSDRQHRRPRQLPSFPFVRKRKASFLGRHDGQ